MDFEFQSTSPDSGFDKPVSKRNRLVLPTPFSPRTCKQSPAVIEKPTPENKQRSPRTQVKSRASSIRPDRSEVGEMCAVMKGFGMNQTAQRIVQEPLMAVKHTERDF